MIKSLFIPCFLILFGSCAQLRNTVSELHLYNDEHRPQVHFSPKKGWMNDPNGMVYNEGTYHLFFQHNPYETKWGPMHWGHATSKDLVKWKEHPIALYPDSLGTIFSGSAVLDRNNTAGFGKNALIAIYTYHNHELEKTGSDRYETQGIAYSTNNGKSWTKYSHNPILENPGIRDFRDPKVFWYEEGKKWIMTLATLDHITFYSSPNLKNWKQESTFGKTLGAHGGVWECPDLFPLSYKGRQMWILIVNINPGGPNGGSATQYFVGDFDGQTFKANHSDIRWLDYGPDEYAGVTWENTGNKRLFIGWMSNWLYANDVPTNNWRSAMTITRELSLKKVGEKYFVSSEPIENLKILNRKVLTATDLNINNYSLTSKLGGLEGPAKLEFNSLDIQTFSITLSNELGEKLIVGFDKQEKYYYIDRSKSGKVNFSDKFAAKYFAPRIANTAAMDLTLVIDKASIELFADGGLTVMTSIFFPNKDFTNIDIYSNDHFKVQSLKFSKLKSIWK